MSGNDPNLDNLSAFGLSFLPTNIPGLGSNPGANITTVQRSPRITTRTTVNSLPVGGNQAVNRSPSPSLTRNVQYMGNSEINIADNVTLSGNNIIAGAGIVDMSKRGKGDDVMDGGPNIHNMPAPNTTINFGNNVTLNAKNNIILGAAYVRIDNEITDKEIKERFYELMGKNWDGTINVGSEEKDENATTTMMKKEIRRRPESILKLCSSICLILWDGAVGTGFLAHIPEFEDVVLLTAGHNFKPHEEFHNHALYFKAMDGDENGKGVVKIPLGKIISRKFSFVTSCKGNRKIANRIADAENINCEIHKRKEGVDVKKDLDYCVITLPGWEKFMRANKMDFLEVNTNQEVAKVGDQSERLFYVGHPHLGCTPGEYTCENADIDNKDHYVKLKVVDKDKGIYQWNNENEESWKLYPTGEQDKLRVDKACPHYDSGYTEAEFSSREGYILGPDKQRFLLSGNEDEEKDTNMAQALRFSYGSKKAEGEIRMKYTLDTKGGASGSPVLGDDYTVNAIHTFWSNTEEISGGVKIAAVREDLQQLKKRYPSYFTDEKEKDFENEADDREEADKCQWCSGPKIGDDQIRIDELEKAKKEGTCARLHLKPEEITYLLDVKDKIFKK